MLAKLKSLKNHQGFMKYFKNTSKPDRSMVKLTYSPKLHAFGCKHTVALEEGIRQMYGYCLQTTLVNNYLNKINKEAICKQ